MRKDELWKTTCFELFFGVPGSESYWEINLSCEGFWNAFAFDQYRTRKKEEERIFLSEFQTHFPEDGFELSATLDLSQIQPQLQQDGFDLDRGNLEASATAVIEDRSGELSYCALKHAGAQPDFHLRDSFVLHI
jgi:hypothetical protein